MKNNLVELRKQAERAVHDMPEGDLKTKAFETILAHLLSSDDGAGAGASVSGKRQKTETLHKPGRQKQSVQQQPKTLTDRILLLKAEAFFKSQRSIDEVRQELRKNGWHYPVTSMSGTLQSLVGRRELRREHVDDEKGKGWRYSNW